MAFCTMYYPFLLVALLLVGIPLTLTFQQSISPHSRQMQGSQLFETPEKDAQRRKLLTTATATTAGWLLTGGTSAARADNFLDTRRAESADLPVGLLESRVLDNVLSPPPYGMESPDVYYPRYVLRPVECNHAWYNDPILTRVPLLVGFLELGK
jgi:hypothetical protein